MFDFLQIFRGKEKRAWDCNSSFAYPAVSIQLYIAIIVDARVRNRMDSRATIYASKRDGDKKVQSLI